MSENVQNSTECCNKNLDELKTICNLLNVLTLYTSLDEQVKRENGKAGEKVQACMERRNYLCQSIAAVDDELAELKTALHIIKEENKTLLESTKCYLEKENGRY